jgi:hypothetical protein
MIAYPIKTETSPRGVRVVINDRYGRFIYEEEAPQDETLHQWFERMRKTAAALAHANIQGGQRSVKNYAAKAVAEQVKSDGAGQGRMSPSYVRKVQEEHEQWKRKEEPKVRKRIKKDMGLSQTPKERIEGSEAWEEVKPGIFKFHGVSMR